jgi:hypothetical protein
MVYFHSIKPQLGNIWYVCFRAICYVYFVIIWYIFRFGMFHQEKSCSPTDNICKQRLLMFNNTYMYTFVVKCVLQNTEINPAKIMKAKIYVVSVKYPSNL